MVNNLIKNLLRCKENTVFEEMAWIWLEELYLEIVSIVLQYKNIGKSRWQGEKNMGVFVFSEKKK